MTKEETARMDTMGHASASRTAGENEATPSSVSHNQVSNKLALPLTAKQRAIFDFIAASIDANGYAPSLEEIGRRFGLSALSTVHKHVEALRHKGWIARRYQHSRAMTLVWQSNACPTCGQARAALRLASEGSET